MIAHWVTFSDRKPGCVEAVNAEEAMQIARVKTGCNPTGAKRLPYPASPRINQHEYPEFGICPSFCFRPEECVGRTACPQNYSCTE